MSKPNLSKSVIIVIVLILIVIISVFAFSRRSQVGPPEPPVAEKQPKLSLVGWADTNGIPNDVYVYGNYAYVGSGGNILDVLDVSDPTQPVLVGREMLGADFSGVSDMHISGNYLYVAGGPGIAVFDISNPAKPRGKRPGGYYVESETGNGMAGVDNYLFLGTNNEGLLIFDISDPVTPVSVGSYDAMVDHIYIFGNYAYTVGDKFLILDISDKINPVLVGEYDGMMPLPRAVHVVNDIAYIAVFGLDALVILDISNPANIVQVGSYSTGEFPNDVYVSGKHAYLSYRDGLSVIDVSDPTNPTLIQDIPGGSHAIFGNDDYIYQASVSSTVSRRLQIFQLK